MTTRSTPTERQKRLGAELRKMRVAAGATTEYAAHEADFDKMIDSIVLPGTQASQAAFPDS